MQRTIRRHIEKDPADLEVLLMLCDNLRNEGFLFDVAKNIAASSDVRSNVAFARFVF